MAWLRVEGEAETEADVDAAVLEESAEDAAEDDELPPVMVNMGLISPVLPNTRRNAEIRA